MPIRVECDQCGLSLMAPDRYAGRTARCKKCGATIQIPSLVDDNNRANQDESIEQDERSSSVEDGKTLPSPPGLVLLLCSLLLTAVIWGVGMSLLYFKEINVEDVSLEAKPNSQVLEGSNRSEPEDEQVEHEKLRIQEMRREAEELLAEARRMQLREEEKMNEIYKNLNKLKEGENLVQNRYLHSFKIEGGRLIVTMRNTSSKSVTPGLTITFIDKNGFVTGSNNVSWLFSSISPGETRVEDQPYSLRFSNSVYYTVNFN